MYALLVYHYVLRQKGESLSQTVSGSPDFSPCRLFDPVAEWTLSLWRIVPGWHPHTG